VRYNAEGFNEKNMDTLSNELREIGDASGKDITSRVYSCAVSAANSQRASIRGTSVGSQFRTSLQSLMDDLERTQPHYIRCIKPNQSKAAGSFVSGEVLTQLRYSGMMEAIRIRREGYAFREDHESFYNRFSVLLTGEDLDGEETGILRLVKALSKRLHVTGADWQIGHSKVFLRRELADKLDRLAKLRVHAAARTLTRFGRSVVLATASSFILTWVRFRLYMKRLNVQHRGVTRLASVVRRRRCQRRFASIKRGLVKIQSHHRRKIAARRVLKIRDPYYGMSFYECQQLLCEQEAQLREASEANRFREAAEWESKM
jgi:myosin heavy subunit